MEKSEGKVNDPGGGCLPFKILPSAQGQLSSFSERHTCGLQGRVIVVTTGCQKPPRVTLWLPRLTPPAPGLAHCGVLMWSWECQAHSGHSEGRGTTLTHLASGGGKESETSFSRLYAKHVNSGTSSPSGSCGLLAQR